MSGPVVVLDGQPYRLTHLAGPGSSGVLAEPAELPPAPLPPGELVTIGDSFTAPESYGALGWPAVVAGRVGRELVNLGVVGSGFVHMWGSSSFPTSVARVPATAELVVVWGGYNDQLVPHTAAHVGAAARATLALVGRVAPEARLLVIGPQWNVYAPPSATILAYRDVVRAAAAEVGAAWADPIVEGWLTEAGDLTGPDGLHPSLIGQGYIADRVTPLVAALLR